MYAEKNLIIKHGGRFETLIIIQESIVVLHMLYAI